MRSSLLITRAQRGGAQREGPASEEEETFGSLTVSRPLALPAAARPHWHAHASLAFRTTGATVK